MKKFFILLMVVLMLAGLTSTSFADGQDRTRDCTEECEPIGDGPYGPNWCK